MKLLIFSDNHRDTNSVKQMLADNKNIDRRFSLGDSEMREHELSELNIVGVKGNYPFEPKFPHELIFNFLGVNIFFTHGHTYNVKLGISRLLRKAHAVNAQIVCFGHTHAPYLKEVGEIVFVNPGSLSKPRFGDKASYAIIEITDKYIDIKIIALHGQKIISQYKKKR